MANCPPPPPVSERVKVLLLEKAEIDETFESY